MDRSLLNNGKNHRKAKKCNHWALDPKWTCNNMSLTTEHLHNIPKNLVLIDFTCWQLKISRNQKKNVLGEAYWVGGPFFCWHPVNISNYMMEFEINGMIYNKDYFIIISIIFMLPFSKVYRAKFKLFFFILCCYYNFILVASDRYQQQKGFTKLGLLKPGRIKL